MSLVRFLRYINNRKKPEPQLCDPVELYARSYPVAVAMTFGKILSASEHIPNVLFSDYEKAPDSGLWTPMRDSASGLLQYLNHNPLPMAYVAVTERLREEKEEDFEVNMVEPLTGWRGWNFQIDLLASTNITSSIWKPDKALKAECRVYIKGDQHHHENVPAEDCTCGIYAVDEREGVPPGAEVIGQVYGWGRYVRGTHGWRAEFAYPKFFLIQPHQAFLVEPLKKYHVPIYVEQPTMIYSPEEDGYEHRSDEENWSIGTGQDPDAGEEDGEDSYD